MLIACSILFCKYRPVNSIRTDSLKHSISVSFTFHSGYTDENHAKNSFAQTTNNSRRILTTLTAVQTVHTQTTHTRDYSHSVRHKHTSCGYATSNINKLFVNVTLYTIARFRGVHPPKSMTQPFPLPSFPHRSPSLFLPFLPPSLPSHSLSFL